MSEPAQEMWFSQTIHTYEPYWLSWVVIYEAHFECHDILMLGKNPIKWRQRTDMIIAVDWDVKHQIKQSFEPCVFRDLQFRCDNAVSANFMSHD